MQRSMDFQRSNRLEKRNQLKNNLPKWIEAFIEEKNMDPKTVTIQVKRPATLQPEMYIKGEYIPEQIKPTGEYICIVKGFTK